MWAEYCEGALRATRSRIVLLDSCDGFRPVAVGFVCLIIRVAAEKYTWQG